MGWQRRDEEGVPCYRWVDWSPHPARVPPPPHDWGGSCAPFLCADLYPDRLELRFGWSWSSGHAERFEEALEAVVRRDDGGWPDSLRAPLVTRFGPEAALEAARLLGDPAALGGDVPPPRRATE